LNEDYIREFTEFFGGKRSNVSPQAWFADVTFVPDARTEELIKQSCEGGRLAMPIIESHPRFGRVFHTLLMGGAIHRKVIAREFDPPASAVTRQREERQMEDAICESLERTGVVFERQVPCGIGIADIVTECRVYEVKKLLSRQTMFHAVGQALAYSRTFDPVLTPVVIGRLTADAVEIARAAGILALDYRTALEKGDLS
jgi:hypothetical protein